MRWLLLLLIISCSDNTDEEMKLFISSLKSNESAPSPVPIPIPTPTTPALKLQAGIDSASDTFFWLRPYLATDWPEITSASGITKKWFWLYSTDHSTGGSYFAHSDDLSLNGWEELGKIFTDDTSSETPRLYRIPENPDGEEICLYYHPVNTPQQTRLYTTSGGSLVGIGGGYGANVNVDWTFKSTILGLHTLANGNQLGGEDEAHTGYLNLIGIDPDDGRYKFRHLAKGGTDSFSRYSYSADGVNVERIIPNIDSNWEPKDDPNTWASGIRPDFIFNIDGVEYGFGGAKDPEFNDVDIRFGTVGKVLDAFEDSYQYMTTIKPGGINWRRLETYYDEENKLIHYYLTPDPPNEIWHSTIDVSQIDNWILP